MFKLNKYLFNKLFDKIKAVKTILLSKIKL